MIEITLCFLIAGSFFVLSLLTWLSLRPVCFHQWGKGEVKEYPPAVGSGDLTFKGEPGSVLKLYGSHTTYIQRCTKCGL
jgi:hypothetical protein